MPAPAVLQRMKPSAVAFASEVMDVCHERSPTQHPGSTSLAPDSSLQRSSVKTGATLSSQTRQQGLTLVQLKERHREERLLAKEQKRGS